MTDGPSVSHSCRPPKITVIFTLQCGNCVPSIGSDKTGCLFFLFVSLGRPSKDSGFGTPFGRFFSRVLTESCPLRISQQLYSENTHKSAKKYARMHGVHSPEGRPRALLRTCGPLMSPVCAPVS